MNTVQTIQMNKILQTHTNDVTCNVQPGS